MSTQGGNLFDNLLGPEPPHVARLPKRKSPSEMEPADWHDRVRKANALNIFLASQIRKYKKEIEVLRAENRKLKSQLRAPRAPCEDDYPDITDLDQGPPEDIQREIDKELS